jgi:hypothetical protein
VLPQGPPPTIAQIDDTRLIPVAGEPEPSTDCLPVEPLALDNMTDEAVHPDGDAAPDLYCPDDPDMERVCVLEGNGSSHCERCDGADFGPLPNGCHCQVDDQCASLSCVGTWAGEDGPETFVGKCYPFDGAPSWQCPTDCEHFFGDGAWCYNQHPLGVAHCIEPQSDPSQVDTCFKEGQGVWAGECLAECSALDACGTLDPFTTFPESDYWTCVGGLCLEPGQ